MSIWSKIIMFMVEKFWPWFKDFVWPFIKEHVVEIIRFVINAFKNKIIKWGNEKFAKRENDARQKAEEAEDKANQSNSNEESEKHRAVAQVWRDVAEQFRKDNEELKRKLDDLETEAQNASEKIVNDFDFEVDFSNEKPRLKIGEKEKELPALPE